MLSRYIPQTGDVCAALNDVLSSFKCAYLWILLGWQDIKIRYRRSILGPFWITISVAFMVFCLSGLYGNLLHTHDDKLYRMFLVAGMVVWTLIAAIINDMSEVYHIYASVIKQIKLPYCFYINRVIWRNVIVFMHNIILVILCAIILGKYDIINAHTLLLIPNACLFYCNAFCYGLLIALLGTRYNDMAQVIKMMVQLGFFVTPVLWSLESLPQQYHAWLYLNPFYLMVELLRSPLIGTVLSWPQYLAVMVLTIIGCSTALVVFANYRKRIVYWI